MSRLKLNHTNSKIGGMDTSIGTEKTRIYRGYIYKKKQPPPVKMGAAVEYLRLYFSPV